MLCNNFIFLLLPLNYGSILPYFLPLGTFPFIQHYMQCKQYAYIIRAFTSQTAEGSERTSANVCRVFGFSNEGKYFAYCDGNVTELLDVEQTGKVILSVELPRTSQVAFTPKSTYMCTYEPFAIYGKDKTQGEPNLRLWDTSTGTLVKAFIQKKSPTWQPQFSDDESLYVRLVGSEILFHTNGNFDKYDSKLVIDKVNDFSLSPGIEPFHVACYIPVVKGQPAVVQVRRYPGFGIIANKTFWKADRVSLKWNKKGNGVIVMAITDVDSTGQSYYGEQNLYLVLTNGESSMVPLSKNGPVYAVEWSPTSNEFCVVYGYMPAKATLYNLKGERIFDGFGTGPRNELHYNAFGTLVCICGFGNLRGNMEFWSLKDRKLVSHVKAEDTTLFQWAPDGRHFLTATTAPRLRVNNGYKIWDYMGNIIDKVDSPEGKEFWEAKWCPAREGTFRPFPLNASSSATGQANAAAGMNVPGGGVLPTGAVKNNAYVPPHLRDNAGGRIKAMLPPGAGEGGGGRGRGRGRGRGQGGGDVKGGTGGAASAAEEKLKKMKNLQRKLDQITQLKEKVDSGEKLELNQMQKIEKEAELRMELQKLTVSA